MERCQEMSHITPTTALVAAIMTAATYHGRPAPRAMACVDGMTAAVSGLAVAGASRDEALPPPLLEDLLGLLVRLIQGDRKSTRLNSSHVSISYAVFC